MTLSAFFSFLSLSLFFFVCVCDTEFWIQGLHQPFFVIGVFKIESQSHELFGGGWFRTVILLISASWVARIIGVSHQWLADFQLF
jgi:hypothetical protein